MEVIRRLKRRQRREGVQRFLVRCADCVHLEGCRQKLGGELMEDGPCSFYPSSWQRRPEK